MYATHFLGLLDNFCQFNDRHLCFDTCPISYRLKNPIALHVNITGETLPEGDKRVNVGYLLNGRPYTRVSLHTMSHNISGYPFKLSIFIAF